MMELLKQTIRPEFLNRIDDVIMFTPLTKKDIREIVKFQLVNLEKLLLANDVHIEATEKAIAALGEQGFEPEFGARPLKRVLQREVINRLSKQILAGNVNKDDKIIIDADAQGELIFSNEKMN